MNLRKMRGGKYYTTSEIFIESDATSPVIKLKISKNTLSSKYTLEIEIDLNLYQGDVRDLLRTLIESFGQTDYPPIVDEKKNIPLSLSFLLGLADIPEQNGDIAHTNNDITRALDGKNVDDDDDETKGDVNSNSIKGLQKLKDQISRLGDSHKKCVITIELSQNSNGILFEVTKYPLISYKEFSYKVKYWDDCLDHDEYDCEGGFYTKTRIVHYPILIVDADATPWAGIDFMNWKQPPDHAPKPLYSFFKKRKNKNTFSITDKTIEKFVEMMKERRTLKFENGFPKIELVVDSQPQPPATPAPGAGAAEPEAPAAEPAAAPAAEPAAAPAAAAQWQ